MRVLVTGHKGLIGRAVDAALRARGCEVVGFDLSEGDVRDAAALRGASRGCEAVVHLAALLASPGESDEEVLEVNLLGTRNALAAAEEEGLCRVVLCSSANALGVFKGERAPDYLPLDDLHPCRPASFYGISKRLAEEMCRHFTARSGVPTICLRPPGVLDDHHYDLFRRAREEDPSFEWTPFWEYGAFVDKRDVAEAVYCALVCEDPGHETLLLCAADISSASRGSRDLASWLHPAVPWRGGPEYDADPFRALIDTTRARRVLGWEPRVRWRE